MKYCKLLLLILILLGVYSCDKESDGYPITYSATSILKYEISFYTNKGKITSPEQINELIKRKSFAFSGISEKDFLKWYLPEIIYLSENEVRLTFKNEIEERNRLVYETDNMIYLEKQEITEYSNSPHGYVDDNYILDSRKLKPLFYETTDISTPINSYQMIKEKECFYIKKINTDLIVPMYEYTHEKYQMVKINDGAYQEEVYSYEFAFPSNNEFNENCVSVMGDKDTLIVEQYYIKIE